VVGTAEDMVEVTQEATAARITPRLMAERTMLRLVAESATPPQPTT
jgi:hypothetical protein